MLMIIKEKHKMHNLIRQLIPRSSLSNHKWNEQHSYKTYQSTFDDEYTLIFVSFFFLLFFLFKYKLNEIQTISTKQKTTVITHVNDFLMKN